MSSLLDECAYCTNGTVKRTAFATPGGFDLVEVDAPCDYCKDARNVEGEEMNEPNKTPLPLRVQTVRWDGRLWWTANIDHQCEQLYLIERETRSAAMVTGGSLEIKGMHYGTWVPMAKVEGYIPELEYPNATGRTVPSCLCGAEWVAQNAVGACRCGPCLVAEDEASVGSRVEWRNFKTDPVGGGR